MQFDGVSALHSERTRPMWWAIIAVAVAETLMAVHVAPAVIASGTVVVMIAAYLLFGGAARSGAGIPTTDVRTAMAALAMVPTARLLSMAIPFVDLPRWTDPMLIAVPLMSGVVVLAVNIGAVGLIVGLRCRTTWIQQVAVIGSGAAVGYLIWSDTWPILQGLTIGPPSPSATAPMVAAVTVSALVDEMLYRGLLQGTLSVALGRHVATWIVIGLYTCASAGYRAPVAAVVFALLGGYLGWCRMRTDCVIGVAVAHVLLSLAVVFQ